MGFETVSGTGWLGAVVIALGGGMAIIAIIFFLTLLRQTREDEIAEAAPADGEDPQDLV